MDSPSQSKKRDTHNILEYDLHLKFFFGPPSLDQVWTFSLFWSWIRASYFFSFFLSFGMDSTSSVHTKHWDFPSTTSFSSPTKSPTKLCGWSISF